MKCLYSSADKLQAIPIHSLCLYVGSHRVGVSDFSHSNLALVLLIATTYVNSYDRSALR